MVVLVPVLAFPYFHHSFTFTPHEKNQKHLHHAGNDSFLQKLEAYQRQAPFSKLAPQAFAAKEHSPLSVIVPLAAAALTPFAALAQACPGAATAGPAVNLGGGKFAVYIDLDNDAVNDIQLYDEPNDLNVSVFNTTQVSVVAGGAANYWYAVRHTAAITTGANFRGVGILSGAGNGSVNAGNYATLEFNGFGQWFVAGTGPVTGCLGIKKGTRLGFVEVGYNNLNNTTPSTNAITLGSYGLSTGAPTTVTCASCASLPVEMRFFKGEIRQKKALLLWATATESNNRGFEIEKSTDGINFFKIGWVDGQGNSMRPVDYSFEDKSLQANQICYYRLKQVDFDGRFDYTKIISLVLDKGGLTLHDFAPNPVATGFTYLKFDALTEGDVQVTLFDASGKIAKEITSAYIAGSNGIRLDLAGLPGGTYYAKVQAGAFVGYKPLAIH